MLKKMALSRREEKRKDKRSAREKRQEARVAPAGPAEDVDDPYGGETDVSGDEEEEEDASARSSPKATAGVKCQGSRGHYRVIHPATKG